MPLEQMILADTPDTLAEGLALLADLETVGVDVERADSDRYYRAAALIQVGGAGRVALIDPVLLDDLAPLDAYLAERRTILHALENDLVPLANADVHPPLVEDTAIAAAILGLPTGLEGLLRDLLGVELEGDKAAMQRAAWEERPLTQQMLDYAAGDVADLPELWEELADRLEDAGRWSWYVQELDATLMQPSIEERRDWSRLKGVGRLDPATRARAQKLWEVREELARTTDTAPGRIIGDKVLVDLAVTPPSARGDLGRRGVRRQSIKEFGDELVGALREAPEEPATRSGPRLRPPTEEDRALAERLRTIRSERATEVGIDAGVLCPNRTLMGAVVADPSTPEELRETLGVRPWQWDLLAEDFLEEFGIGETGEGAGDRPDEERTT